MALARRCDSDALVVAPPTPPARRLSRFPNRSRNMASTSGNKGDKLAKPDNGDGDVRRVSVDEGNKHERNKVICSDAVLLCGEGPPGGELSEFASSDDEQLGGDYPNYPAEDVDPLRIFPYSTHRDGSIYRGKCSWKKDYRIANRKETCIEAMMLSEPKDCMFYDGTCRMHSSGHMLQIFSLKLSKIPLDAGSIELYGYIATRDILNPLLNYVVNFSRNDPIIVEQGSLIEMTGPKRGIELIDTTLIEYDMRIKTGEQEKDDLQLIDGVSFIDDRSATNECAFTRRIHGDCGAIDITVSHIDEAVEATIEVYISEVRGSFSLCVGCLTSGLSQEIQLFDGAIDESCGLRRSVVAVVIDAWVDLKFKVSAGPSYSSGDAEHWCTFKVINHGWTSQLIKAEFASILVKVTWSTFPLSNM